MFSSPPSPCTLAVPPQDAIRLEQFGRASTIKSELDQLPADSVAFAKQQLQEALEQERYEDAAAFRDGALTGLEGWWSSQQHEEDPVGHLLHIAPEYSRWTGRMFRPRDLVDIKVIEG